MGEGSTFWVELPLGVGRETLFPSAQNGDSDSDEPGSTDLAKVRAAAKTMGDLPKAESMTDKLTKVVDAAALEASRNSPSFTSTTALQGLMEQSKCLLLYRALSGLVLISLLCRWTRGAYRTIWLTACAYDFAEQSALGEIIGVSPAPSDVRANAEQAILPQREYYVYYHYCHHGCHLLSGYDSSDV